MREVRAGETILTNSLHPAEYVFGSPGYSASRLHESRAQVLEKLNGMFSKIAEDECGLAKIACQEMSSCQLRYKMAVDKNGQPTEAIFTCPKDNDACGEIPLDTASAVHQRVKLAVDCIEQTIDRQY
ncbi:MAG: hypothetical protein NVS1B10_05680 [Candidatus Saccharimonadales bacterium]